MGKTSKKRTCSGFVMVNENIEVLKCPFRRACLNGELQTMKDIYEKNANIEMNVDRSGWNGLHHAAAAGQMKPIEIMLYWNFDVNAVTNDNETPILLATRSGHKEVTQFLLENGADPFISSKNKSNPLLEAAKKNRPEIVELLQDAINSHEPTSTSTHSDEAVLAGGPTTAEFKALTQKLKQANEKIKDQDNQIKTFKSEIEFHERESAIKTEKMKNITEKYKADAFEKEEMVKNIKHDIDVVELDVRKSNQLLHAEQELRESLEDENLKLMEMVRQRETTIKKLESRTRNALEISIKADDAMRLNSVKMEKLQKANAELKELNSVQARSEKMADQDDFATFGTALLEKISKLNETVMGLQIENQKLKAQSNDTKKLENIKQQNEKLNEELTKMKQENVRLQADHKEAFDELNLLEKDVFALVQVKQNNQMIRELTTPKGDLTGELHVSPDYAKLENDLTVLHQENAYLARRLHKLESPKK